MDEDAEENYGEEHPDSENGLRFSEGHQDQRTEEVLEYELDFEEDLDEYKENQFENEGDWEQEDKQDFEIKLKAIESQDMKRKRKSIYNLDSFVSSTMVTTDLSITDDLGKLDAIPERRIRYSQSIGVSGIARLNLSHITQKIIGCVIDENITTEFPWLYVKKELIEDNIDLHDESSDFLPVKEEIENFPDTNILIGYAPSSTEEGQFYICLNEAGRDAVIRQIEIQRIEQESRVQNAVLKTIGQWKDLGSAAEIDATIVKKNRPLFEIEIESTANLLNKRVNLMDRNVDDQRDGYVRLVPHRETFQNVIKALVDSANQTGLTYENKEAQTTTPFQINAKSQHAYEYSPIDISKFSESKSEAFKKFLEKYRADICNELLLNSTWDLYTSDYTKFMHSEKNSQPIMTIDYKEHQSYYDGNFCLDKVINELSWHPLWTGIAACSYTDYAKSTRFSGPKLNNEIKRSNKGKNQTLVWSFNDCLAPKLVLESPREVTVVSICPHNENVIIGGCSNGQIAIWHIPGKIKKMEAIIVHTTAQVKYRIAMKNLMAWMRDTIGVSAVDITAMSSLQSSQKGRITQIAWVPAYNKVGKDGRIINFPEDTDSKDLSCQFLTASEDGTIAFWDLKWEPATRKIKQADKTKVPRPDVLLQSISPYKALDGLIEPDYILLLQYPESIRRAVISTMNIFTPMIPVEQVKPFQKKESDISTRRYYRHIFKKPPYEMLPKIFIGTAEGICGIITWEGYNFSTGQLVNRESCKWAWLNIIHDGPVTHAIRSEFISDLIMTVGGRIFALWTENFHRPFFWKKSKYRYTSCSWSNYRASTLLVARSDGTIEVWNFATKSIEPTFTQSFSGGIIPGIYNHHLPLNPQCVAFCDFNGALRVFLAPSKMVDVEENKEWMQHFMKRTISGIQKFEAWQKQWSDTNVKSIERNRKLAEIENAKRLEETEEKFKAEMLEAASKLDSSSKVQYVKRSSDF
ncbi:WD repeat-containing protein 63-like [Belonocnema kinseyi]|uniref:WD repeat-containing protein 63-like n=1 Tax=Belonocnema kinseyi TaxID=2817044 RepID=UPI00143DCC29|nr:WD repeat-containing protein 63-like [Belonocnema kinseyi]